MSDMVFEFRTSTQRDMTGRELRRRGFECYSVPARRGDLAYSLRVRESTDERRAAVEHLVRKQVSDAKRID